MRFMRRNWLATFTIAAGLAVVAVPALAKNDVPDVDVRSFTGAYLAGRAAEADRDLDAAIGFYQRALSFDPANQALQQSLMLSLISKGSFDQALPFAEKLKDVPEIEQFSRLALAVDALRKNDYTKAEYWLKFSLPSDLDRLITGLMRGWAKAGAGTRRTPRSS